MSETFSPSPDMHSPDQSVPSTSLGTINTPQQLADHVAAHPEDFHEGLLPHIQGYLEREGIDLSPPVESPDSPEQPPEIQILQPEEPPAQAEYIEPVTEPVVVIDVKESQDKALQQANLMLAKKDIALNYIEKSQKVEQLPGDKIPTITPEVLRTIEKLSAMTPQEAKAYIDGLKTAKYASYDLKDYKEYVAYQRAVRSQQKEYITQRMNSLPANATEQQRREAYLEAVSYSPNIGARILRQLKADDVSWSSQKLLSSSEVAELSKTKESFDAKMSQLLVNKPTVIVGQLGLFEGIMSKSSLQEALYRTVQVKPEFITSSDIRLPFVLGRLFDTPEQIKAFLVASSQSVNGFSAQIVSDETLRGYFDDSEVKQMVESMVKSGNTSLGYSLESLIKQGLISDEQVMSFLQTPDINRPYLNLLYRNLQIAQKESYGIEKDIPENLRLFAVEQVNMIIDLPDTPMYELMSAVESGVLSEAHIKEIINTRFTQTDGFVVFESAGYFGDDIKKYFTDEQLIMASHSLILSQDSFSIGRNLERIIKFNVLSQEELISAIGLLSPGSFLDNVNLYIKVLGYDNEQSTNAVIGAFNELGADDQSFRLQTISEYVSSEDLQQIVLSISKAGEVISKFTLNEDLLKKLGDFDASQLPYLALDSILQQSEISTYNVKNALSVIEDFKGLDAAKQKTQEIISLLDSAQLVELIFKAENLFDAEFITNTVQSLINDPKLEALFLGDMSYGSTWIRYVTKEQVTSFIESVSDAKLVDIVSNPEVFNRFIDSQSNRNIINRLIKVDPAAAYNKLSIISAQYDDIDEMTIVESVNQQRGVGKFDAYLQDIMSRAIGHDRENSKQLLLAQASTAYQSMALIKSRGVTEQLQTIMKTSNTTNAQSLQLLESVATILTISAAASFEGITDSSQVNSLLIESVAAYIGANINPQAQNDETISTAQILGVYMRQHIQSKDHSKLAATLLEQISAGTFNEWKFGSSSEQTLQVLKDQGLLPAQLTFEQLKIWSQDETTDMQDTFSIEAETAVKALVGVLYDNETYLSDALQSDDDVKAAIADIGAKIAEVEKQKQLLRQSADTELASRQLLQVQQESEELRRQLSGLQLTEDIQALVKLSADELKAGSLLQQEGKKSRSIKTITTRLRKNLPSANSFIADQIDSVIDSYSLQTDDVQQMSVSDTSDLITTLRVGVEPVGSCQNYRNGELNTSLIGYTDPNTKVLVLRNAKGTQVARAIYRMVSDDQGLPALHLDTIYTTDSSDAARRALYTHAAQKAASMGVPLYVSNSSQDHQGVSRTTREIDGVRLQSQPAVRLTSGGSRAPQVYVDAAGGLQNGGVYSLRKLSELSV